MREFLVESVRLPDVASSDRARDLTQSTGSVGRYSHHH